MSSRGYLWDLIESIAEDIALASHIEEKLVASENEQEVENLKLMLKEVLSLRREKMSYLLSQGEKPNPMYWCLAKHSIGSYWRQMEVWEASQEEEDLTKLKKNGEILAMALSLYLGLEFQTCQRCVGDLLMVKQHKLDKIKEKEKQNDN